MLYLQYQLKNSLGEPYKWVPGDQIALFGVFFGQNLGIWPPGVPINGAPQMVIHLILKI